MLNSGLGIYPDYQSVLLGIETQKGLERKEVRYGRNKGN